MSPFINDHDERFGPVVGLVVFAIVVRAFAVAFLDIAPTSDAAAYLRMAETFIEHGRMTDTHGNLAFYSAGYPLLLSLFFLAFGQSLLVAQMLNLVLAAGSVVLIYACATHVSRDDPRVPVLACLLWALYPPSILYAEYVAKENLTVFLLLLQAYLMLLYVRSARRTALAISLGVVFGVNVLVGGSVILTFMVMIIVVFYFDRSGIFAFFRVLLIALSAVTTLVPWLAYTNYHLGSPVLNTNSGFNLYLGNNPTAGVGFVGIQHTPAAEIWPEMRAKLGEVQASKMLAGKAMEHIQNNPFETIFLTVRKLIYFWMPPVHEGKGGNSGLIEWGMRVAWMLAYSIMVLFAVSVVVRGAYRKPAVLIILGMILSYWAIHGVAYIIFRYRLPIMPFVGILAAYGLSDFFGKLSRSRSGS